MATYTYHDLIRDARQGSFSSVGSYPIFFLARDGGTICPKCIRENLMLCARATRDGYERGWAIVACDANWEDPSMFCENCNNRIESAYAEDDALTA